MWFKVLPTVKLLSFRETRVSIMSLISHTFPQRQMKATKVSNSDAIMFVTHSVASLKHIVSICFHSVCMPHIYLFVYCNLYAKVGVWLKDYSLLFRLLLYLFIVSQSRNDDIQCSIFILFICDMMILCISWTVLNWTDLADYTILPNVTIPVLEVAQGFCWPFPNLSIAALKAVSPFQSEPFSRKNC